MSGIRNAHVKRWGALQDSRGIERFRQCLVFGKKVVREMVVRHPGRCLELLCSAGDRDPFPLPAHVRTHTLPRALFNTIDSFGTGGPILICTVPPLPRVDLMVQPQGLELLCPLGDPTNVGALIRTAAAMGVRQVVLLKESAHPCHPKATRAASGAMFDVQLVQGPSIRDLPEPATWVTLHARGENMAVFPWPEDVRLVVGEEGPGLPRVPSSRCLAIPMTDAVESLNAVVAASMALYAYRVQYPLLRRMRPAPGVPPTALDSCVRRNACPWRPVRPGDGGGV